jgi:hypothetical protein
VFGDEPAQIEKEALPPPNSYGSATVGHLILYNFSLDKCFFIGVISYRPFEIPDTFNSVESAGIYDFVD